MSNTTNKQLYSVRNGNHNFDDSCTLLSGTQTYVVQIFLGFIALSTLYYKRQVERPKRTFQIWSMDVFKQGLGALVAHVLNLLIAMDLPPVTDECAWYFINFTADCTLGMAIAIYFLQMQQELAELFQLHRLVLSGDYGSPPSYRTLFVQTFAWIVIIVLCKAIITVILILCSHPLGVLGNWLFSPFQHKPFTELVIVMIICPCFLNVMQFWIQDSYLKKDAQERCDLQEGMDPDLLKSLL